MAELFKFLKKTNPNLDITFDPNTNTVKVHNSEERIKELQRIKELERQKEVEIRRKLERQRIKNIERHKNQKKITQKSIKTEPNKPQVTPIIRTQYRRIGSGRWS